MHGHAHAASQSCCVWPPPWRRGDFSLITFVPLYLHGHNGVVAFRPTTRSCPPPPPAGFGNPISRRTPAYGASATAEQEFPFFLGLERKIIRARAIKQPPGFCLQNAKIALNGAQSPRRKTPVLALKVPKFVFSRAGARKLIRFLGLARIKQKRRNSSSVPLGPARRCQNSKTVPFSLIPKVCGHAAMLEQAELRGIPMGPNGPPNAKGTA